LAHGITYASADPQKGGAPVHFSTLGGTLERLRYEGPSEIYLGNMTLVFLYEVWEGRIRAKVAEAHGVKRDDLLVPLFGDVRHLRNLILHAGAFADKRVLKFEVFGWFQPGDQIEIGRERLYEIVRAIRALPKGIPGWH
jgi:hypothetical protein